MLYNILYCSFRDTFGYVNSNELHWAGSKVGSKDSSFMTGISECNFKTYKIKIEKKRRGRMEEGRRWVRKEQKEKSGYTQ